MEPSRPKIFTQRNGVTSRKNGVIETKDLYTKTRRHIPEEWSRRDQSSLHKDTASHPGRMESSRSKLFTQRHDVTSRKNGVVETKDLYTKTRRHIPEEWSHRDQRSRTHRRVMMTQETCGVSEMTSWWINRSAHDIAWCWRNC